MSKPIVHLSSILITEFIKL